MKIMQKKFIDEVFGEEIEYTIIKEHGYYIIVYLVDNKINIKQFYNIEKLVEELITTREEKEFLNTLIESQELEIDDLKNVIEQEGMRDVR
ncbi:MAG: hypothetical protein Q4G05_00355 [Clostridia bacterium]|nr:hypothetical protein [Clostridia bacterium]